MAGRFHIWETFVLVWSIPYAVPSRDQATQLRMTSFSEIPDENEIEEVIDELPRLVAVRSWAQELGNIPWFKRVGDPVEAELAKVARTYLDLLGFPDVEMAPIQDWETAAAAAESLDWNSDGWQAEEQLRASLATDALTHIDEQAISVVLNHVAGKAGQVMEDVAAELSALWDVDDTALVTAAAGSAIQMCHQAALVIVCEADDDHPFVHKLKLFQMGRWPISIAGSSFNLF